MRATQGHASTLLALPWYVNGTLEADGKAEVERHLAVCPSCRAALAEEERLAQQISRIEVDDIGAEVAFLRLEASLGPPPRRDAGRALSRRVRGLGRAVGWGIAGALAASLALAVFVGPPGTGGVETGPQFRTLSEGGLPAAGTVQIIPAAPADGAAVRRIAEVHDLALVSGPSETGVWTFTAPSGVDLQELEQHLRRDPAVGFASVETGP